MKKYYEFANDTPMNEIRELWDELSDVGIDINDDITSEWRGFAKGTSRFDIWTWFEECFNVSVALDLMNLPEDEV